MWVVVICKVEKKYDPASKNARWGFGSNNIKEIKNGKK
jgi:hypothetical protein